MKSRIIVLDEFKRNAKKLLKKYSSLKEELAQLEQELLANPKMGTQISLNTFKIRLAVRSKGKGKSGGLRVITHVIELQISVNESAHEQYLTIFLHTIYDKSEMENIKDKDLKFLINEAIEELNNEN